MTSASLRVREPANPDHVGIRRYCVYALYFLAALWGVAQIVSHSNSLLNVLFPLLLASTVTYWAIADSKVRRSHFLRICQEVLFFTWPVATLIYLVWTRQWLGLGWWILHAMGLVAALCLTFYPTYTFLYWLGWIAEDHLF